MLQYKKQIIFERNGNVQIRNTPSFLTSKQVRQLQCKRVITQGSRGGILYDGKAVAAYPAFRVNAVDSNGAGDVFHGAFAAAVMMGYAYGKCCLFASAVSALKCTGIGARESAPNIESVKKFLKENGYEL